MKPTVQNPFPTVPGLEWELPHAQATIDRDHETEAFFRDDSHWYRVSGYDRSFASVTTILGIIDKSQALLNWHQRSITNRIRHFAALPQSLGGPPPLSNSNEFLQWMESQLTDAAREPDRLKNEAADLGTRIHKAVEQTLLQGNTEGIREADLPAVEAALLFLQDQRLTPLAAETHVWHPEERYAGQVDCIAQHADGTIAVIDWKSGNRLYSAYEYQAAAYAEAVTKLRGQVAGHAYVVQLPKNKNGINSRYRNNGGNGNGSNGNQDQLRYDFLKVKSIDQAYSTFLAAKRLWDALH